SPGGGDPRAGEGGSLQVRGLPRIGAERNRRQGGDTGCPMTLWRSLRRISLTRWILISMVVGVLIGWLNPGLGESLKPLSTIFLRMIKAVVVPLIFGSLGIGIAGQG